MAFFGGLHPPRNQAALLRPCPCKLLAVIRGISASGHHTPSRISAHRKTLAIACCRPPLRTAFRDGRHDNCLMWRRGLAEDQSGPTPYRELAAQCLQLAAATTDKVYKSVLLRTAAKWSELAEQEERYPRQSETSAWGGVRRPADFSSSVEATAASRVAAAARAAILLTSNCIKSAVELAARARNARLLRSYPGDATWAI
jgi:hypothetical protein